MNWSLEEKGTIGNLRYEVRKYGIICEKYDVVIFSQNMGLTVVENSSLVACQAFIAGMKVGKCRHIRSVANKNLKYSEYGADPKDGT